MSPSFLTIDSINFKFLCFSLRLKWNNAQDKKKSGTRSKLFLFSPVNLLMTTGAFSLKIPISSDNAMEGERPKVRSTQTIQSSYTTPAMTSYTSLGRYFVANGHKTCCGTTSHKIKTIIFKNCFLINSSKYFYVTKLSFRLFTILIDTTVV